MGLRTPAHDIGLILQAVRFAAEKHRDQRRKDVEASPYINHPIALADLLFRAAAVSDPVVLCAAILHDTIEDTDTTAQELVRAFGREVADVVVEVTDDKTLPKEVRKRLQIEHAARASTAAKLVKLADKICNLRDLEAAPPADWSEERKRGYREWAVRVVAGLRGTNYALECLFDALCTARSGDGTKAVR